MNLPGNLEEVPPDLQDIQPFPSQVWNFDEILFDLNRSWYNIVCTYKFLEADRICRGQMCEWAPFWCTALVRTRANEQYLIPPVQVHQSMHYITTYPVIV